MKPTIVHLPSSMIEELDRRSERSGVSRAQVIRDAIGAHLRQDEGLAEQYLTAYEAMPLSHPDEWGDLHAWLEEVRRVRSG